MQDTYRHRGLRKKLAESLHQKGIKDERVLTAIELIPRHFFLDKTFEGHAYQDKAFPIGKEQTISQPFTVAFQTELLQVKKRDKVLEIGTGSGYQAAVLASLGARVFTLERHEFLSKKAKKLLREMGIRGVRFFFRDGSEGLPEYAPFDKIIVTAGAAEIPQSLLEQLKIGGILVIPVGKTAQKMMRIIRRSEETYEEEIWGDFRFVPFLKGIEE